MFPAAKNCLSFFGAAALGCAAVFAPLVPLLVLLLVRPLDALLDAPPSSLLTLQPDVFELPAEPPNVFELPLDVLRLVPVVCCMPVCCPLCVVWLPIVAESAVR